MLPDARVAAVGTALAARFGLPHWQLAQTASDANRAALRWARALTGRPKVLVFHGGYHGIVEETMVRLRGGRTVPREGAVGPAFDPALAAIAVDFNDEERALLLPRAVPVLNFYSDLLAVHKYPLSEKYCLKRLI
jgi:glutamate-1-semialdehyde 2,1-aminomutase